MMARQEFGTHMVCTDDCFLHGKYREILESFLASNFFAQAW